MNFRLKDGGAGLKTKLVTLSAAVVLSGAAVFAPVAAVADHTTAHTIEQLSAQIASLQAQLAALSGQTVSSGKCSFTRDLTLGVKGDDVKCLQDYLKSTGHFTYAGGSTAYFGSITQAAVAAWQTANAVSPAAGYFGPKSKAKYDSVVVSAPSAPGGPVAVGTGLTVSAAVDQPAATLVPASAARAPFTKVVFTASADGDVTVKSVKVERQGLADDSSFSSIILLDENNVQLGDSKTLNALHQVTLSGSFTVKAGTSRTMIVAANMDSDLSQEAGQVGKLSVVAVDAGSSQVNATLPIAGNGMTINGTLTIGSIASPARGTLDPGAAKSALEVGSKAVYLSGVRWTVGSAEAVMLEQLRWYQSGSVATGDLANVKVNVKSVDYDAEVSSDGKYYTAKFGAGVEYDKGATIDIGIKADVVSGSNRTIDFDILKRTHLVARGKTFGYYITPANGTSDPTDDTGAFSNTEPYYDAYEHTISRGSLRLEKSNVVSAGNVPVDVSSTELGAFALEAKGENVQVSSFKVTFALSAGEDGTQIDNLSVVDENGSVVAGPKDVGSDETVTFTDTFTVPTGLHTYKLKGKLTTDFEDADTIAASVDPDGDITAKGETTGLTITASPASAVSANTLTVRRAALSVSVASSPAAQNVVRGVNAFLFSKIQYDATNSGEDLRITTQELTITTSAAADADDLNTCQVLDGSTALNTGTNVVNPSGNAAGADPEVSFALDTHLIVPKGTLKSVDVKCNISSNAAGSESYSIGIADTNDDTVVTGKDTGVSVTESVTTSVGQTMTIRTSGVLSLTLDPSSPVVERHAIAGKTDVLLGVLKLHADYEVIKLDRLAMTLSSSTASTSDILKVALYDGATKVGEAVFAGGNTRATSTLSADFIVPKDGDKLLTLKGDLALLGVNEPAVRGHLIAVNYDGEGTTTTRGLGQSSGSFIAPAQGADTGGAGVRLVKSYPTLERLSVPSNTLANMEMVLYRFKATADAAGDVGVARMTFRVSSTTVATTSVFKLYAYSDSGFSTQAYTNNPVHSRNISKTGDTTWGNGPADDGELNFYFNPVNYTNPAAAASTSEAISIPAGSSRYFELKGTVASSATGDTVSVALLGDAGVASNTNLVGRQTANGVDAAGVTNNNFIWSPNTTTTSATTTDDWLNGYQVSGLPSTEMTQQTFSK